MAHILRIRRIRTNVVLKIRSLGSTEADERKRDKLQMRVEELEELQSCMETCRDAVEASSDEFAYTFLGINANYGLVSTLGSVGATFLSYIWAMYVKDSHIRGEVLTLP